MAVFLCVLLSNVSVHVCLELYVGTVSNKKERKDNGFWNLTICLFHKTNCFIILYHFSKIYLQVLSYFMTVSCDDSTSKDKSFLYNFDDLSARLLCHTRFFLNFFSNFSKTKRENLILLFYYHRAMKIC